MFWCLIYGEKKKIKTIITPVRTKFIQRSQVTSGSYIGSTTVLTNPALLSHTWGILMNHLSAFIREKKHSHFFLQLIPSYFSNTFACFIHCKDKRTNSKILRFINLSLNTNFYPILSLHFAKKYLNVLVRKKTGNTCNNLLKNLKKITV